MEGRELIWFEQVQQLWQSGLRLLLNPAHPESIIGWQDSITAEALAELLDITLQDATARFQGRKTWKEDERTRLVQCLLERRARLSPSVG